MSETLLRIFAAVVVVVGIMQLLQGQLMFGAILVIAGLLVGPGGVSILSRDRATY